MLNLNVEEKMKTDIHITFTYIYIKIPRVN